MAISFQLDLTPNQIDFLQQMDLYADGDDRAFSMAVMHQASLTWIRKLTREGLVEHVPEIPGKQHYSGSRLRGTGGDVVQAYRITPKGRTVLGLIEQDVELFVARQKEYRAKKKGLKIKKA